MSKGLYRLTSFDQAVGGTGSHAHRGDRGESLYPVRVTPYPSATGIDAQCRWLDDGDDLELM